MLTGKLDKRVTFRRREVTNPDAGNERGDFVDWFTVWANYRGLNLSQSGEAGMQVGSAIGILTVRDGGDARNVTTAERVLIQGEEFAILSPEVRDRTGFMSFRVERNLAG
jgi:head-tail adaptor